MHRFAGLSGFSHFYELQEFYAGFEMVQLLTDASRLGLERTP